MTEDVFELPENGEAGHADGVDGDFAPASTALNPESLESHLDTLLPETRGSLEHRVMALSDATIRNLSYIIKSVSE